MNPNADVAVIGAGIAGISAAHHLAAAGVGRVLLIDVRPPLSLTSDKSTECYRNWWPGPGEAMVGLMNRSIDILEGIARETGNRINLNRRGYLFATADAGRISQFQAAAEESASLGAGPVRIHRAGSVPSYAPAPGSGYEGQPTGADVILDPAVLRRDFPYLAQNTLAAVHARRCGWFSGQQLGAHWLESASGNGMERMEAEFIGAQVVNSRVKAIRVRSASGEERIEVGAVVLAAGPLLGEAAALLGVSLPVYCELHAKASMPDPLGVVPRDAPLLIWADPQAVIWDGEERRALSEDPATAWMLGELPSGVHVRPEGSGGSSILLILWTYDNRPVPPTFPPQFDPNYGEIALRGLATMIPGLAAYFTRRPRITVDGGYYLKTRENRPLVGPLPVQGAYVLGALSGFGLMASPACGELLAAHLTGGDLPSYADAFRLERYEDPAYRKLLEDWKSSGQL
ncbi:MAG: FAD-dependent oxidoreductase [Anaerolineales bacterium]